MGFTADRLQRHVSRIELDSMSAYCMIHAPNEEAIMMNDAANVATDPMAELTAMTEIAKALQQLDGEAVRRVLAWAGARFGAPSFPEAAVPAERMARGDTDGTSNAQNGVVSQFDEVADLYSHIGPGSDPEKALVVGYWFQKRGGQPEFDSGSVNRELKHLGYGVGNITAALSSLMARKPQLVIQTKKSGSSQQARKRYKLTNEGIKHVERMIRGEGE